MALIKSSQAHSLTHEAIVLDLGDLKQQAQRLRLRAQQQADQILADAKRNAEMLAAEAKQQGHQQGLAEGHAEGLAQGRAEGHAEALAASGNQLQAIEAQWLASVEDWVARRTQVERDAQNDLLRLACMMAERIVHRVPEVDPSVVVDQVHAAIHHVVGSVRVTIRVNPEDRPLLEEAMPRLSQRLVEATHVEWVEDVSVARGGCVIDHGEGHIDATLEKQLDRLVADMMPGAEGGRS